MRRLFKKVLAFLLCSALVLGLVPAGGTFASETSTQTVTAGASGNIVVGLQGTYQYLEKATILARINEIRKEAYDEGLVNSYVPMKWSHDLEYIARIRAAETTFVGIRHARANGGNVFMSYNGVSGHAENIAWNFSGIMAGIEQWYDEKSDYVNHVSGAVTGHYTSMINPSFNYCGLACFKSSEAGYYIILDQYTYGSGLDETQFAKEGEVVQKLEVAPSYIKGVSVSGNASLNVDGTTTLKASLTSADGWRGNGLSLVPYDSLEWSSSTPSVATVNSSGKVTGVAPGSAAITAKCGSYSGTINVTVDIKKPVLKYRAYVQKKNWMAWSTASISGTKESTMAGTTDNLRMETIQMQLSGIGGSVEYRAYCAKKGWTQWATTADKKTYAGTKGESRRVELIQLRAKGEVANYYDMYFRAYSEKLGWLNWAKNGEKAGTQGYAYKLEAFQVNFVKKGESFGLTKQSTRAKSFYDKTKDGANPK